MKTTLNIAAATALAVSSTGLLAAPEKVTVGYLNLVNAQLVTKNLGLMAKHMPEVA